MGDYNSTGDDCCYEDNEDDYSHPYDDDLDDHNGMDESVDDDEDCLERVDTEVVMERDSSIKVITKESLLTTQSEDLHQVMDLLSLKECHARTLLIHYRWDLEKVFTVFVEHGKEKLCAAAGVPVVEPAGLPTFHSSFMVCCNICFEEVSANHVTTMDCGHYFCNDCWAEHFSVKINEGQSRRIKCMQYKCNAICDEAKIRQLVYSRDPELAEKFNRFLLESYIEDNRRVKWCPSVPHCGNAIRVEDAELCEVECACGLQFCFSCSSEAHSPCSCRMWEFWSKKCEDESESVNWLTVHTKPCPKCRRPVEKNGGCNLVICVCHQAFCWLCGTATGTDHTWTSITGHSCGRYTDEREISLELAKRHLDRYIHYHSRYKAHIDSSILEAKLKEEVQEKINVMSERNTTSKDFTWIRNGLSRLYRYRQVLSCSYAFAFYMFGDDLFKDEMTEQERMMKQNLFEDQQQQFEANIERLSMALSEKFHEHSEVEFFSYRMKFLALSKATDTLCRNLYEYIESDLLGNLQWTVHRIASYKLKRVG